MKWASFHVGGLRVSTHPAPSRSRSARSRSPTSTRAWSCSPTAASISSGPSPRRTRRPSPAAARRPTRETQSRPRPRASQRSSPADCRRQGHDPQGERHVHGSGDPAPLHGGRVRDRGPHLRVVVDRGDDRGDRRPRHREPLRDAGGRGQDQPAGQGPVPRREGRASGTSSCRPPAPTREGTPATRISKGKLELALDYKIANRTSTRRTSWCSISSPSATRSTAPTPSRLPVRLAVALLKDRHGVIDVDLPIAGSLDDPKFKVWARDPEGAGHPDGQGGDGAVLADRVGVRRR